MAPYTEEKRGLTIEPGIYRNKKTNNLYFAEKVVADKDTDTKKVFYYALYPNEDYRDGCTRSIPVFMQKNELVTPISASMVDMFLPGARLKDTRDSVFPHRVISVTSDDSEGKITVNVDNFPGGSLPFTVEAFVLRFYGAE